MALKGEFYGSTSNGFIKPKISWRAQQFPEENYSLVTATLTYSRTNTGFVTSGTWTGSLTIGEDTKWESRYLSISYDSNTVAISHTARIDHDAYGSAKVQIRANGSIPETTLENTSVFQTVELDVIALASTVAATDAFVEAVCMVAVSRKNASFTHSIALSCNGYERYLTADGKLADTEQKLEETAIAFPVPALFYDLMPQSPTVKVRLTCRTYDGQTQVGLAQETEFTLTARQSLCAPEAELTVEDIDPKTLALTGNSGCLVRYASTARCTLAARPRNGAQIVSRRIGGVETEEDAREFPQVETDTFAAQATDTRGYTTQVQLKLPMVPYIQLTVNATAKRTDPTSGRAILTVWGNYFDGSFGAQENTLTLTCQAGNRQLSLTPVISEGSYRAELLVEELDYTGTHILTVTGRDAVMQTDAAIIVKPGIPVFDWGQKDFAFHVPVYAEGGLQIEGKQLWEHIYPVGSIYMSVLETEPAALFGGRWERLKDRFLLSAGDEYAPGATGGEAEHTLTNGELPANMGKFSAMRWPENLEEGIVTAQQRATNTLYSQGTNYGTGEYTLSGGGEAHNNMPPYLAVFMWKRVA